MAEWSNAPDCKSGIYALVRIQVVPPNLNEEIIMKLYGIKRSAFGMVYKDINKDRQENFYDSLKRACKKRARQESKKLSKEDYKYSEDGRGS